MPRSLGPSYLRFRKLLSACYAVRPAYNGVNRLVESRANQGSILEAERDPKREGSKEILRCLTQESIRTAAPVLDWSNWTGQLIPQWAVESGVLTS